jgi:hypothetical protein
MVLNNKANTSVCQTTNNNKNNNDANTRLHHDLSHPCRLKPANKNQPDTIIGYTAIEKKEASG